MHELLVTLSAEDCITILQNLLKHDNFKLISYSNNPFSDQIDGIACIHLGLKIDYLHHGISKSQQFFMKVINSNLKAIFELSESINAHDKEEFIYALFKEFKTKNLDVSFAAESYFSKPNLLVLENMTLKGFKKLNKSGNFDIDHCKTTLNAMAKFHASSILYESIKSTELGRPYRLTENSRSIFLQFHLSKEEGAMKKFVEISRNGICAMIKFIPENHVKNSEFEEKLRKFIANVAAVEDTFLEAKSTLLHGDLWCNNVLFKYEDGRPAECVLLDYQIVKYGPPCLDLLHMFYCNTRKAFRDQHFDELIDYYYARLKKCLDEHEFNGTAAKTEYLNFKREYKLLTKLTCISARTMTFTPENVLNEAFKNDENCKKYLYDNRCEYMVDTIKEGGLFREIVEEDMLELRDILFS